MENFSVYQLTVYLGIVGLLCMSFSFLSGLRFIKPKPKYKLHKRIGIIGFTAVVIHGFTMLFFTLFE
jgi:hypothetical protein